MGCWLYILLVSISVGNLVNRAHGIAIDTSFGIPERLDMSKIHGAVDCALELMDGVFDIRNLQANDRSCDWEFRAVDQLSTRYGVLAYYHREGPLVTILWDSCLPLAEIRVSIAHELGHHFIHALAGQTKACSQDERDLIELEAEVFARILLAEEGR